MGRLLRQLLLVRFSRQSVELIVLESDKGILTYLFGTGCTFTACIGVLSDGRA